MYVDKIPLIGKRPNEDTKHLSKIIMMIVVLLLIIIIIYVYVYIWKGIL